MTMTAVERVFNTPELMGLILEHFVGQERQSSPGNPLGFADLTSLQRCSLVNKWWFVHIMRFFWKNPTPARIIPLAFQGYLPFEGPFETSLVQRFTGTNVVHRPLYAGWVREANLMVVSEVNETNALFRGVEFPILHSLVIFLDPDVRPVRLPVIRAPNLSRIEINSWTFNLGASDQYVAYEPARKAPRHQRIMELRDIIGVGDYSAQTEWYIEDANAFRARIRTATLP